MWIGITLLGIVLFLLLLTALPPSEKYIGLTSYDVLPSGQNLSYHMKQLGESPYGRIIFLTEYHREPDNFVFDSEIEKAVADNPDLKFAILMIPHFILDVVLSGPVNAIRGLPYDAIQVIHAKGGATQKMLEALLSGRNVGIFIHKGFQHKCGGYHLVDMFREKTGEYPEMIAGRYLPHDDPPKRFGATMSVEYEVMDTACSNDCESFNKQRDSYLFPNS